MRDEECHNWASGKDCAILDAENVCVSKHVGEKGNKPNATFEHFKNRA